MSLGKTSRFVTQLHNRYLLKLSGKDTTKFLQGLVTQDVELLAKQSPKPTLSYTGLLNKRGRLINEGFLAPLSESCEDWLLDVHPETGPELVQHLKLFRLRSRVDISIVSDSYSVWVAPGFQHIEQVIADLIPEKPIVCSLDPRVGRLGLRFYTPFSKSHNLEENEERYHLWRMIYGIPEGGRDYSFLHSLLFEANLDYLNGISFSKGCYLGQETAARVKYTGVVRKRIVPVVFSKTENQAIQIAEAMNRFYESPPCSDGDVTCPILQAKVDNSFVGIDNSNAVVHSQLFAPSNPKAVGKVTSCSSYPIGLARVELASAFPNVSSAIGIPLKLEQSEMYAVALKPFWWPREDIEQSPKATQSEQGA
ncbi:hypothetical protein GAYE_SCF17G3782 [Galdieria yellowstonensis]|uniref:Aminomethyltransferase folate-binding domain-containing protein n=1 Tax=Galdieria yellowstonensis TaxID=3028027 RepID=A0AAV9IET1_9RHOD|nr:hypothetical protein GAYE_SCF17G3782 [Galdieria yellowstonensis]